MSSTNLVNFSLRPNKSIERSIVFDSLREYVTVAKLRHPAYVGFGSIWFADFVLAHKRLKISKMVSIEHDSVVASRAHFNCPYSFLTVERGESGEVLPRLLERDGFKVSPWIVWLDYDGTLVTDCLSDIYLLLSRAPVGSALIVTFNIEAEKYGKLGNRRERLQDLFPEAEEIPDDHLNSNASFARTIQGLLIDDMVAYASKHGRKGGSIAAFNMRYRDSQWMATVGVLLPSESNSAVVQAMVSKPSWRGMPSEPINTPTLTPREVAVLQSQLPRRGGLTRRRVRQLGFDLDQETINAYVKYYSDYPNYVQVGT